MLKEHQIRFAEHVILEEPSFVVPVRLYETRHYFLDEALYICYLSPTSTMHSGGGEHARDNQKVWLTTLEDVQHRGLLETYYDEIGFLFVIGFFGLSLSTCAQKGNGVSVPEMLELQYQVFHYFPDILRNPYLQGGDLWNQFLATALQIEVSEKSMEVVNKMLSSFINGSR
jgi:hypothetical protein